jgi:hypothetical protein
MSADKPTGTWDFTSTVLTDCAQSSIENDMVWPVGGVWLQTICVWSYRPMQARA